MIEITGSLLSLISVWLTTKNNIWCWPIGILGIIIYAYIFYANEQYINLILQFVFLAQSLYAWFNWNKDEYKEITRYKKASLILLTILIIAICYGFGVLLNGNSILLDAITTGLSLVAMYLLSMKKLESWILWILADLCYIPLFIISGNYVSALLYFIFLILAINGYNNWRKNVNTFGSLKN